MKTVIRIAITLAAIAAAAVAAAEDLSFPPAIESPWIEWKGLCRFPGFVKYHMTVRTSGDAFNGTLRVKSDATYTVDLQVPVASTREVAIQILVASAAVSPMVSLQDEKGREVLPPQGLPKPILLPQGRAVAGLIAGEGAPGWFDPSKFDQAITTVAVWPSAAPSLFEDYEPADLVVMDCEVTLSDSAAAALARWVESGGILFLPNMDLCDRHQFKKPLFAKLFPDRAPVRSIVPEGVLEKWGTWNFRTIMLESLKAYKGVESPISEDGWLAVSRLGKGRIVILSDSPPRGKDAAEEALSATWRLILDDMAGFDLSQSPPNRERLVTKVRLVEPKLHRFFERVSWPEDILARAETGITAYAALAAVSLMFSGILFVRKRMHFAMALLVCVGGALMLTIGFMPRRTAVGETLDMVEMRNASTAAAQSKLLHVASFTGSTVTCSFSQRDGDRLNKVAYSPDELGQDGPTWHFGDRTEIRDIRLDEGSRFLALAARSRFDLGSVDVRMSEGCYEIENSFKHPLLACAILKNGRFLPVGDMRFGDLPRRIEADAGWITLPEQMENLKKLRNPSGPRVLKAFFDEYYTQGRTVFVAFFDEKSQGFGSDDLIWKKDNLSFLYIDLEGF